MPALVASAAPTDAEPIPGGVAAPDGAELYLQVAGGIDAVDPATGGVRWTTRSATVPVLATADVLFALAADTEGDAAWTGPARLVAIDRAAPHAARSGQPFSLPPGLRRVLDARIDGDTLALWWQNDPIPDRRGEPPPPTTGALRIALADGSATGDRSWIPDAVTAASAGQAPWSPPGRAADPWRTDDGWSIVVPVPADGGAALTLHHWSAGRSEHVARLLDPAYLHSSAVEHVDRRHLFLRVCEPGNPPRCALRIFDAATGAAIATVDDPAPPAPRPTPPFALVGRTLLAVRGAELVALDVGGGDPRWRRPHLTIPERELPP
jgi:hypothetical protein